MEQQQEEFRSIPGYEGLYEVSNFGTVKNLTINKILKPSLNNQKYYLVGLSKDGKRRNIKIHVLTAMTFLGHIPDGTLKIVVDHIDNNKLNNHIDNLQLISQRENSSKDKKSCSSKYIGVSWNKSRNKWKSEIRINHKKKHLGSFTSEEEAHEAYQRALKIYLDGGDLSFMEPKEYSSKYKGVSWDKKSNKWAAYITINSKSKYLGYFTSEEEAYDVYCKQKMNAE
jgi:hypothetical protein